jgi:hypothetical protein
MDAITARNTALDNHPSYQKVLEAIQAAITASPPQFECEVYLGRPHGSYSIVQALVTKLRSDFYSVEYDPLTCMLSIDWSSVPETTRNKGD